MMSLTQRQIGVTSRHVAAGSQWLGIAVTTRGQRAGVSVMMAPRLRRR